MLDKNLKVNTKSIYQVHSRISWPVFSTTEQKERKAFGGAAGNPVWQPLVFYLSDSRRDAILNERDEIFDWTAQVVEDAMLDDLVR